MLYILAVVAINPLGEFAINDDWAYKRQVESFRLGNLTISDYIDPSFILQMLIGGLWAMVFGDSFISLRLLTMLVTLLSGYGVRSVMKTLKIPANLQSLVLILFFFNPLIFHLSMTFMTDMYFLVFFIWSIHFYLKGNVDGSRSLLYLQLGSVFGALSVLVRQLGVVIFISFALAALLAYLPLLHRSKALVLGGVTFTVGLAIYILWPRYQVIGDLSAVSGLSKVLSSLIQIKQIPQRLGVMLYTPFYLAFFTLPIIFALKTSWRRVCRFILLLLTVPLTVCLFNLDVFPAGNVLYLEGLNIKAYFRHDLNLFDNTLFRVVLAGFISYALVKVLALLFVHRKKILPKFFKFETTFLGLTTLGMFFILFFGNDFYDRYLIPAAVALILFAVAKFKDSIKINNFSLVTLLLITLLAVFLQTDFFTRTKLKWTFADNLQAETGLYSQIYLNGVYSKYTNVSRKGDYTGLIRLESGSNFKCFVRDYTTDTGFPLLRLLEGWENLFSRVADIPRALGTRKPVGIPSAKKHMDEFKYNQDYFSPVYNTIGKKAFVGAWCTDL